MRITNKERWFSLYSRRSFPDQSSCVAKAERTYVLKDVAGGINPAQTALQSPSFFIVVSVELKWCTSCPARPFKKFVPSPIISLDEVSAKYFSQIRWASLFPKELVG